MIGQLLLEVVHQAHRVLGLDLLDDGHVLVLILHGEAGQHRALEGIDEADAGVPVAQQGNGGVGGGGGQGGNLRLGEHVGARQRQAGGIRAQHGHNACVHQGLGRHGRFHLVGLAVGFHQLNLLAQHLGVHFQGQLEALGLHGAAAGIGAGQGLKDTDLDNILRHSHAGEKHAYRQQQSKYLLHNLFPPSSS